MSQRNVPAGAGSAASGGGAHSGAQPSPEQAPPNDPAAARPSSTPSEPQAASSPKRVPFSRPITPTTPFSPQNAVHAALLQAQAHAQQRAQQQGQQGSPQQGSPQGPSQQAQQQGQQAQQAGGYTAARPPNHGGAAYAAPPAGSPGPLPVLPGTHGPPMGSPPMGSPPMGSPPMVATPHSMQAQGQGQVQTNYNAHAAQSVLHHPTPGPPPVLRADNPQGYRVASAHVVRSRSYSFLLDPRGNPIEIGSGRFGKAYLGEERWLESKTDFRRTVVIKVLQKGVGDEDVMRFQMEKELLERVQGHPNVVKLFSSGEGEDPEFIPGSIRDKVEAEFVILEKMQMSLEERLKGSRTKGEKDELLGVGMQERIFRVLDYMIPIASAVEFAHLVKNISHRDIKPANVLIALPDATLRGSALEVRLADFNVAKVLDDDVSLQMTQMKGVPGTLFFQSPEQETNVIELLVNVQQGSPEVEYFEDFYIQIAKNDAFALFNRGEQYPILHADRARKKLVLGRPWREGSEANVRAKIQKSVGRPADIYSLGAMLYYLISGAYANPKTLYDNFHKFIEYERADESNTIEAYLEHEYSVINSLRAPKNEGGVQVAPADRFFSYKHYLDGNGELIDPHVMKIVAKCMIRNKPDSYCQAHDVETRGVSDLVQGLIDLYTVFGVHPSARPQNLARMGRVRGKGIFVRTLDRFGNRLRWMWLAFLAVFRKRK